MVRTGKEHSRHPRSSIHAGAHRNHVIRAACAAVAVMLASPVDASDASTHPPSVPSSCSGVGLVWWNELLAPEIDKITEFYATVVGWNVKVVDAENQTQPATTPNNRYTIFMAGDQEAAGLMKANHPVAMHSGVGWFTYIQVADVDTAVARAQATGGTILRQPIEMSDGGRIAVVSDPMGNVFGLVTPKKGTC